MTFDPFSEIFSMLQCYFLWQAQYLVKFNGVSCCSAHCKCRFQYLVKFKHRSLFSGQVQYLVRFKCLFSGQVQYLVKFKCLFSGQVQYLVKFKCLFSGQVQYLEDVGVSLFVAGAALGEMLEW